MSNYRRARIAGGTYFFTVALMDRASTLFVDRIDTLRAAFRVAARARPFRIEAIVVLPDHLHCIWTLPPGDSEYSIRWAHIKASFSRAIPRVKTPRRSLDVRRERGIWQRRFWEHVIRNEADFCAHADYIHFNPVKHGLAASPRDWPHSSFRRFAARGAYPLDWGGGVHAAPGEARPEP